jgi:hypothetical protein
MRPVTLTLVSFVAAANSIALSQARGAAGNFTLNGALVSAGVATLPAPSQVLIHSAGNDSGITFTVTGTDKDANALSETVTGKNVGDAITVHRFKTVTQIATSAAAAGNVTAGTTTTTNSEPCPVDYKPTPTDIGLQFTTSGTTTAFKAQYSMDSAWDYADADTFNANGAWFDHATLTAMTAKAYGSILTNVCAVRLQSNQGGTDTGTLKVMQGGI